MNFLNFDLVEILLSLPAVFLAMTVHEFAHAFVAYKMGDPTPKFQGRLTLDPLAHVDWIGFISFALFGFGWAKPVQVNPSNFRNKRVGDILVSVAGPLANITLALLAYFIFLILLIAIPMFPDIGSRIIDKIIWLNVVFSILNLIPIPPFDGYHILKALLKARPYMFFMQYERYGLLVLLAFIWFGVFDVLVGVPAGFIYSLMSQLASAIFMML
jgi:Zn-dependent protease